jgi:glutamate 5-kinase
LRYIYFVTILLAMEAINNSRKIIIKIGSSLVSNTITGRVNHYWLAGLAKDIVELRQAGKQVCVVSSGSVALGRAALQLPYCGAISQPIKQAAAACGQIMQMRIWQEVFAEDCVQVAQVLLTIDDSEVRRRFLNARTTLNALLELGVVPIINENDTVATGDLRVGDNDRLAARVAQMIDADLLILFSDVAGIYTENPHHNERAILLERITEINDEVRGYAAPPTTNVGTGGMITKVKAAEIATASGCHTIIALGAVHRPLASLMAGAKHSIFIAGKTPLGARKEWIAGSLSPTGRIMVDNGAVTALRSGRSLLPVGVVAIEGRFNRGDAVSVLQNNMVIAKGLVAYDFEELQKIIGTQSKNIASILGYERGDAIIHRDDMVVLF